MCVLETSDSTLLLCPHCDHFSRKQRHFLAKNPPYTFSGQAPMTLQHYSCWSPSVARPGSVLPLVFYLPARRLPPTLASWTHHSQSGGGTGGSLVYEPYLVHACSLGGDALGSPVLLGVWRTQEESNLFLEARTLKLNEIKFISALCHPPQSLKSFYTCLEWILTCVSSSSKLFFRKGAKNIF